MKILALEFSSAHRSAAVWADGLVRGHAEEAGGRTSRAFALIETALLAAKIEREQIDCLAVGLGPGSYTGIRVAISVAQGWQLAGGLKLLGISSVEAVAAQARVAGLRGTVHVVIDAQRDELYLATYDISHTEIHEIGQLRLASLAEAQSRAAAGGMVIGPEANRWFPDARLIFPEAAVMAELASKRSDFIKGEQLEPIYLRAASFVKAPPPRILPGA